MKRKELFQLKQALERVSTLKGVKFAYSIAKNLQEVNKEIEAVNKAIAPSEEFMKYEKERIKLNEEYAEKTEDGSPKVLNNNYVISPRNRGSYEKRMEDLKNKHKKVLSERDEQIKEYQALLEENVDITLHKIQEDNLPSDITAEQIHGILQVIE